MTEDTVSRRNATLVVVSETSVLRVFAWAALGRRVVSFGVYSHLPRTESWLKKLHGALVRRGWIIPAETLDTRVRCICDMPNFACLSDFYLKCEPWVEEAFSFAKQDRRLGAFSTIFKQSSWLFIEKIANIALAVDAFRADGGGNEARIFGGPWELSSVADFYSGDRAREGRASRAGILGRVLVNLLLTAGTVGYSIYWTLRRLRIGQPVPRSFLLGATYRNDPRLFKNLDDIADRRDQVALLFFDRGEYEADRNDIAGFEPLFFWETPVRPLDLPEYWFTSVCGGVKIFCRLATAAPNHFLAVVKCTLFQVGYRALLRANAFKCFWGRDDHDHTHQVRSRELRRVGAVSMGINHGIPTTDIVEPGWRFIDFDIYYVFGRRLYDEYYAERWPHHMKVDAIGAFGMSVREMMDIAVPRSRDIVIFANPTLDNDRIVRTTLALAEAFPDRKVIFKSKQGIKRRFFEDLYSGKLIIPENLELNSGDYTETYRLLRICGYMVSTISTLGAEGVYYGIRTFILDTQPDDYPLYYREFKDLTFREPETVIARIRALENGSAQYPWSDYEGLADQSYRNPFDRVRAELGLPPKLRSAIIEPLRETRLVTECPERFRQS